MTHRKLKRLRRKLRLDERAMSQQLGLQNEGYYVAIEKGKKPISRRIEIIAEFLAENADVRAMSAA